MTSPRTPRQWSVDSEEPPADVLVLRYEHDLPFQFARRTGDAWTLEAHPDPSTWVSENRESWKYVSDYCAEWGPLSEVLPETPEPVEPPCVDDCCSATGPARLAAELSRVIHEFAEDLPWPDSQRLGADAARAVWAAGSKAPVPASQSVPAVPVSSTGGADSGEAAGTATEALSVHWYPVVDDTIGGWAISNVDLPVSQLDTRGGQHFVVGGFLSEEIARHLCELHNAALLPDSETEWGIRIRGEKDAQEIGAEQWAHSVVRGHEGYEVVQRRAAGPWIEVTS